MSSSELPRQLSRFVSPDIAYVIDRHLDRDLDNFLDLAIARDFARALDQHFDNEVDIPLNGDAWGEHEESTSWTGVKIIEGAIGDIICHALDVYQPLSRALERDTEYHTKLARQSFDLHDTLNGFISRRFDSGEMRDFAMRAYRETVDQANKDQHVGGEISQPAVSILISQSAKRLLALEAKLLPVENQVRYAEEFQAELSYLAEAKASRSKQVIYAIRQLRQVWRLRAALLAPRHPQYFRLYLFARWMLASEWRTWGSVGPLLAFAIVNVHMQQGWGSALFTLPGVVAFYAGVEWLRKRWGVVMKRSQRRRSDSEG